MDSPQLLHMAFLLLALAAPHPNIAMSAVGPAEEIVDNRTVVKFYHCKDCNSCPCKPGEISLLKYTIIADTQNKSFPDELIHQENNKTHTTVCFEEPNSCRNETYGIYWWRAGKPGLACGHLSSGENGRGGMSTEKKTICCEAETGTNKHNPHLKCFYSQQSHPKLSTLQAAIPGEGIPGNPEFLTSKKKSTGILFAFLFVVVCTVWGTMYYCLRLRRRGQACRRDRQAHEGENLPLQEDQVEQREPLCQQHPPPLSGCTATD